MHGAAMNWRQDPSRQPQHQDSSSLHNPGYHLQINRQQNLQPQNSKTLNYPSFSNYQVEGYYDNYYHLQSNVDSRHPAREVEDPRFQRARAVKRRHEPIDLPVPQFEIDEHSVFEHYNPNDGSIQGSKALDLDTRIGLLIKSKALAGMHPIFSDLNDSGDSESDLEYPCLNKSRSKSRKKSVNRVSPIQRNMESPFCESFDDPEKPLSRPPSPFLSRATYLFWFNKAIEIKQQAKAQEQALLEQATKRLIHDTSSSLRKNQMDFPKKVNLSKSLMDEISKELKVVLKQEFLKEVIEQTAFNTLDVWWEKQNQEKLNELESSKSESVLHQEPLIGNSESQGSTSPKIPFPWHEDRDYQTNLQDDNNMKHFEEITYETSRNNQREKHSHLVPNNTDISSNAFELQGDEGLESEETSFEASKEKINLNHEGVTSNLVNEKIDKSAGYEDKKFLNIAKPIVPKCSTKFEYDVLAPSQVNQLPLSSNADDLLVCKMDNKFAIVKDVLDFIFNKVDNILMQRNDNALSVK